MNIKSSLDSISSFIIDPSNDSRTTLVQGIAWITTIVLGIGTIGIAQGLSALWRKMRPVERNVTHEKIGRLFQRIFSQKNTSKTYESLSSPEEGPSALQVLARNVYDKREQLWEAAKNETEGNKERLLVFINKIREEFRNNSLSLSMVSDDEKALNILFQSQRLRTALVIYARVKKLDCILNKHLVFLAQDIYNKRNDLTTLAKDNLFVLACTIIGLFECENRSLVEILMNKEALKIFNQSNRLKLILFIYLSSKQKENKQNDFDQNHRKEAVRLGKENAQGPGLVTRLNMNDLKSNPKQLEKAVKNFLRSNHPDKMKSKANISRVQDANQLLDLLRRDNYKIYNDTLNKYRNQLEVGL